MRVKRVVRRLPRSPGAIRSQADIGIHTSGLDQFSSPANSGGAMPMIVKGREFMATVLPRAAGSPPKRFCQKRWLRTITGAAEAVCADSENTRP
jgi:hypothetical protein